MSCGGQCWITEYQVGYNVTGAKYIGNCVEAGPGVDFDDTSEGVAWNALVKHMEKEFETVVTGCEAPCKCRKITPEVFKDTEMGDWNDDTIVVVHDSSAGRCIIEYSYQYASGSTRFEGTCEKVEVASTPVYYVERTQKKLDVAKGSEWATMEVIKKEGKIGLT